MSPAHGPIILPDHKLLRQLTELAGMIQPRDQSFPPADATVLVFRSRGPVHLLARIEQADPGCVAVAGPTGALVLSKDVRSLRRLAESSADLRLGLGHLVPGSMMHYSCARAVDALAFTHYDSAVSRAVSFDELGTLSVLGAFTSHGLVNLPGMSVVSSINETAAGRSELLAVEAMCRTGSLRSAALALRIHHSSVASRVRNVEGEFGHSLRGAIPLTSAYAAILGLRILAERAVQSVSPELRGDRPAPAHQ